ncbi:hypothetical protein GGI19_003458 [Coemansia pectinata]|uniref:histone acetyltransferase n=1 Tax=Coemansia pectinata TaxID=1052879 RepID=A0A9W8LAY1_9FUNG|nr:hypothetical protein GGI19_003458 [Coemansia pectinata]
MASMPAPQPVHRRALVAEYIAESLRTLPAGSSFAVRVVYTADQPVDSLTPRRRLSHFHAENTLSRRVLAFVSQGGCLVAGLEVHEFTTLRIEAQGAQPPRTSTTVDCCIEKLDTSGELAGRMPMARALVAGYLRSLHRYSTALNIPSVGVHLFARAQPEYLFAKSKDNPGKRILGDLELVKWWQSALQFALEYSAKSICTAVANCIVPGSTMRESSWFFGKDCTLGAGSMNNNANGSCTERAQSVDWKWGLPYPLGARAHDCVLQFPDDPITRLLSEPHSSAWSVSGLLDMLSVSEECGSGHRTAYFMASLPLCPGISAQAGDIADSSTASQGHLSFEDYDRILVALFDHEMDFSSTASAYLSSNRLKDYLDSNFDIPLISAETTGPAITREPIQAATPYNLPTVNDLSTVIRKKRKIVS